MPGASDHSVTGNSLHPFYILVFYSSQNQTQRWVFKIRHFPYFTFSKQYSLLIIIIILPALPGPPTEVRSSEVTATTVRLTWTYNGPEEPQYYVIQYKPKYANQVRRQIWHLFDRPSGYKCNMGLLFNTRGV